MPKKSSSSRKRGIAWGIPRHRVRPKDETDRRTEENIEKNSRFRRSKLSSFGEKCFKFKTLCCTKLHLVGFTSSATGKFVPASRKDQIWHYIVAAFFLALSIEKIWGTTQMFKNEELRVESFLCLCLALIYGGGILLSLGVVLRPKETIDLLNSWAHISDSLESIDPSSQSRPLDNIPTCLKVISSLLVTQGICLAVLLFSFCMDDLPTFLFARVQRLGWLPEGLLPRWAWQILFAPMEWLMAQPYMLMAAYTPDFLFMQNGLLDIYLQHLR